MSTRAELFTTNPMNFLRRTRAFQVGAIVVAATGTMNSCASPAPEQTQGTTVNTFASPVGACEPSLALIAFAKDPEIQKKEAEECEDVYKDAKVALVNYALSKSDARAVAVGIEDRVQETTGGLINPQITVVTPSKAAIKLFHKENPHGTIDDTNTLDYSSYDAAVTMPSLKKYDKIIGVTNDKATSGTNLKTAGEAAGIAEPQEFNRYAEEFQTEDFVKALKKNDGKPDITKDLGGGISSVQELNIPPDIAAHELLHLFGLGHSGNLYSQDGNAAGINTDLGEWFGANNTSEVDLVNFLATGRYNEYGGNDVMGSPDNLPKDSMLNIPEQYLLEWPERILDNKTSIASEDFTNQPVEFNSETQQNTIAVMNLDTPLIMPSGNASTITDFGTSQQFNRIAFTPLIDNGQVYGAQMYIIGEYNSVVDMGKFVPDDTTPVEYRIKSNDQTIVLSINLRSQSQSLQLQVEK